MKVKYRTLTGAVASLLAISSVASAQKAEGWKYSSKLRISAAGAIALAQKAESWPYGKLHENADIVVMARAVSSAPTEDKWEDSDFEKGRFVGVETTFVVAQALKGQPADSFKVLHFRYKDPSAPHNDSPGLVSFLTQARTNDARQTGGAPKGEILGDPPEYLLFLKKRADGRFEAVSGQMDPEASVWELSDMWGAKGEHGTKQVGYLSEFGLQPHVADDLEGGSFYFDVGEKAGSGERILVFHEPGTKIPDQSGRRIEIMAHALHIELDVEEGTKVFARKPFLLLNWRYLDDE